MTEKIEAFLKDKRALIVDPSTSSITSTQLVLKSLGLKSEDISQAKTYQTAIELLHSLRPQIVICEYNIEKHFGIDLIHHQNKLYPDAENRIFILLTSNSADSSVAEAAEEDVDAYLLKPFAMDQLKAKLFSAILGKVNPSEYQKKIREGKLAEKAGEYRKGSEFLFVSAGKA